MRSKVIRNNCAKEGASLCIMLGFFIVKHFSKPSGSSLLYTTKTRASFAPQIAFIVNSRSELMFLPACVCSSAYFDEPQYSLPSASGTATTTAEYEIPVTSPTQSQATPTTTPPPPLPHVYDYAVVTSPTESQATPTTTPPPSLPPHVYDYAAVPPSSTAPPEYAVLEPPGHMYHCLEFPGPPEPAERSCEGQGTEQTVVESEYSVIGQN